MSQSTQTWLLAPPLLSDCPSGQHLEEVRRLCFEPSFSANLYASLRCWLLLHSPWALYSTCQGELWTVLHHRHSRDMLTNRLVLLDSAYKLQILQQPRITLMLRTRWPTTWRHWPYRVLAMTSLSSYVQYSNNNQYKRRHVNWTYYSSKQTAITKRPLASAWKHSSYGDCLEIKRERYQNSSVLDCVTQCSPSAAHLYEQFLQVKEIGFVTLEPLRCA